jgi:hypothetical protein
MRDDGGRRGHRAGSTSSSTSEPSRPLAPPTDQAVRGGPAYKEREQGDELGWPGARAHLPELRMPRGGVVGGRLCGSPPPHPLRTLLSYVGHRLPTFQSKSTTAGGGVAAGRSRGEAVCKQPDGEKN